MGFKDNIVKSVASNVANHVVEALDKQVNGKLVVDQVQDVLIKRGLNPKSLKQMSEGPIFNITCEMQEGLWEDKKALAAELRRRANLLDPIPAANQK